MARTKNRNQELKIARQAKAFKNQSKKKKDILFILSLFFTGFPYFTTAILFLLNGIIPPKYHEVKILLPEVIDALNKFAQISVENAWNDMPDHSGWYMISHENFNKSSTKEDLEQLAEKKCKKKPKKQEMMLYFKGIEEDAMITKPSQQSQNSQDSSNPCDIL